MTNSLHNQLILRRPLRLSVGLVGALVFLAAAAMVSSVRAKSSETMTTSPVAVSSQTLQRDASYTVQRVYAGRLSHRRDALLGFQFGGRVADIQVEEGSQVQKGDTLATLDMAQLQARLDSANAQFANAEARLAVAQADFELANINYKRRTNLIDQGHISSQQLDDAKFTLQKAEATLDVAGTSVDQAKAELSAVQVQIDEATIEAPFAGIVQSRLMDEGVIAAPGQAVLQLVEHGVMEARIGVPIDVAGKLSVGNSYSFASGGTELSGELRKLLPQVDAATGTVTALFDLRSEALFAGALVELKFEIEVQQEGFWVPLAALSESHRGLWSVLVVGPDNTVESRLVEVIHREEQRVFVRGTLDDGDQIIESGVDRVVVGQLVNIRD